MFLKKLGYSFSLCYGLINEILIFSLLDEIVSEKILDKIVLWILIIVVFVRVMDRGVI